MITRMKHFHCVTAIRFIGAVCMTVCVLFIVAPAHADDLLCPEIDVNNAVTPTGIAGVQADIERLNLCVERAKLLRQLDEVVVKRHEMIDKARNPSALSGGMGGMGMIPSLPVGSLPNVSGINSGSIPQNLQPGEVRITGPGQAPLQAISPFVAGQEWKIRKIWGQGIGMNAQLVYSGGVLLNVLKGQPLPNGMVIESISGRGVTVSQGGKITDLSWDDAPMEQVSDTSGRGGRS